MSTRGAAGAGVWLRLLLCVTARAYLVLLASLALWAVGPTVLGWQSVVVMTGSMEPKVRPGDALVVQPKAASELQPGQVVVVHDPAVRGRLLSHRLVARLSNSELITKGDANANADSTPVKPEAVLGLAQLRVPYIGLVWKWQQESWPATGIGAVALTLAAVLAAACDPDEPGTRGWKGLRALRRPSGSPTSA